MARTFDIRFARSDGIAAILESPANTFRLRGTGSLSIDDTGLEIEPKRGLHSFLSRRVRVRISAAHLREVSREGDSVRIEYGLPGSKRIVLPFWVRDPETAIEILKLVPTQRTIERDEPAALPPTTRRGHSTAIVIVAAFISLLVGVVVTALIENHREADAAAARVVEASRGTPPIVAGPTAGPPVTPAPSLRVNGELPQVYPSAPLESAAPSAWRDATRPVGDAYLSTETMGSADAGYADPTQRAPSVPFYPISEALNFYREAGDLRALALDSDMSPRDLETRWWKLTVRLYNSAAFDARPRHPLVDAEIGLSLNWRASLANYADAMESGDPYRIESARADLERAGELTDHLDIFTR